MSSLLSVVLVASSSSGPRLLFAYPPNAVAIPRVQRPIYGKSAAVRDVQDRSGHNSSSSEEDDEGDDMFGSRFIRGESSSSSSSEDEAEDTGAFVDEYEIKEAKERESYQTYLGMSTSVLGSLLCPPKELCNRRFELVINHLALIAHPAILGGRRHDNDIESLWLSDGEQDGQEEEVDHLHESHDDLRKGRSAPSSTVGSRRPSRSAPQHARGSRDPSATRQPAQPASSRASSNTRSLPPAAQLVMSSSSVGSPSPVAAPPQSDLDNFAVVLVIDSPPDQHLSYHLGVYYRDVVVPIMAGLKYEERRSGYISEEVARIASMREHAMDTGRMSAGALLFQVLKATGNSGVPLSPHVEDLLRESSLCAQLAALYDGIKTDGIAKLTFADDIDMSVLLHSELFQSSRYNPAASPYGSTFDRHALTLQQRQLVNPYNNHRLDLARLTSRLTGGILEGPAIHLDIAPWQTLLPLQDPEDLMKEVDEEGLLVGFLELMNPT